MITHSRETYQPTIMRMENGVFLLAQLSQHELWMLWLKSKFSHCSRPLVDRSGDDPSRRIIRIHSGDPYDHLWNTNSISWNDRGSLSTARCWHFAEVKCHVLWRFFISSQAVNEPVNPLWLKLAAQLPQQHRLRGMGWVVEICRNGFPIGGLEHEFYVFPYIGNNTPIWLSYFSER